MRSVNQGVSPPVGNLCQLGWQPVPLREPAVVRHSDMVWFVRVGSRKAKRKRSLRQESAEAPHSCRRLCSAPALAARK